MTRHTWATWGLVIALVASNLAWAVAYHRLSLDEMQGAALLQWSNEIIKAGQLDCGKD